LKLFISQPMRDKIDEEILTERNRIIDECKNIYGNDIEVLDSFFGEVPHDITPLFYLGESIKKLGQSDIVYFAPGWNNCRGCRTEHFVAEQYGIKIVHD
jgi:hypothetical protein